MKLINIYLLDNACMLMYFVGTTSAVISPPASGGVLRFGGKPRKTGVLSPRTGHPHKSAAGNVLVG